MLSKIGSFKFHIESYVCDFTGKVTLPVIGNFILQAATLHAHERGFGYEAVVKDDAVWVLSRLSIEIYEYPGYDQDLTVETWIEDVTRFFTQRCFRFINQEDKTIGYARTVWAAINITTRRPLDIPVWRPNLVDYVDDTIGCTIEKINKIPEVTISYTSSYTVRYSDIDINCHMNSIKYMEHTIDMFNLENFKKKNIRRFEMVYLNEGLFGDKLKLHIEEINPDEFLIDTKKDDKSICRSRIIWK